MRKFFLGLFCAVASLMPQVLWADISHSVSGGVLTITTTEVGTLSGQEFSDAEKAATKIVLTGYFNSADLAAINSTAGFSAVTEVDMTEAHFGNTDGSVPEFNSTDDANPSSFVGRYIKVSDTYYKATANTSEWIADLTPLADGATAPTYGTEATIYLFKTTDGRDASKSYNHGTYCAVGSAYIYQEKWTSAAVTSGTSESVIVYATKDNTPKVENTAYYVGALYKSVLTSGTESTYHWEKITNDNTEHTTLLYPTADAMNAATAPTAADLYAAVVTQETYAKDWIEDTSSSYGSQATIKVYQTLQAGKDAYASPSLNDNFFVGTFYQFKKQFTWTSTTAQEATQDYTLMDFRGWASTLVTATTSRYADTGMNGDMFEGCYNLKTVTYKAGNAIFPVNNPGSYNLETVIIGEGVTLISGGFKEKTSLTTLRFENPCSTTGENLAIGSDAFMSCSNMEVDGLFPNRLASIGAHAFQDAKVGVFEVCEENADARITTIVSSAFTRSKLTKIVVPASVTLIESSAFDTPKEVEAIYFKESRTNPQPNLVIKSGAFAFGGSETDYKLKDVYVNINKNDRLLIAEYGAFAKISAVGQTDVLNGGLIAKLHFPNDDAGVNWDYYAGNWKIGLAFTQSNLDQIWGGYVNEYITGATGMGTTLDTTTGKYDKTSPANGWQQFAMTSTGIDIIIPEAAFLRTFSTKKPQVIPQYAADEYKDGQKIHSQDDPMFKIYRISAFNDGYTEGAGTDAPGESVTPKAVATEIVAKVSNRNYIPANTGVIMASGASNDAVLAYMSTISTENTEYEHPWAETGDKTNLLYPTCIDVQYTRPSGIPEKAKTPEVVNLDGGDTGVQLYSTIPCPFNRKANTEAQGKLMYRIFGLSTNESKKGQFTRLGGTDGESIVMTRDKAYLKLNTNLFHYSNEGDGVTNSGVNPSTGEPLSASSGAPIMMSFEDENGETTAIRMIDPATLTVVDDCYYTLQGAKLNARPTAQGVYIHNGKKIIIK